jgi:hypothetical protein
VFHTFFALESMVEQRHALPGEKLNRDRQEALPRKLRNHLHWLQRSLPIAARLLFAKFIHVARTRTGV